MEDNRHLADDRISIKGLFLRIADWIMYLWNHWKLILIGTTVIAGLYITYHLVRSAKYTAGTTFVLEVGGAEGGQISSLASAVGLSIGGFSSESELFSGENILELYRSYRMLKKTFLTKREFEGETTRLITRYAEQQRLLKKWQRKKGLQDFTFEVPVAEMRVAHDSLLMEVVEDFREKNMIAEKVSRRLSILRVSVTSKDQLFAKAFNEEIVLNVNEFYKETKTKKTFSNLKVLQFQADSVRKALDDALLKFGQVTEGIPNPNPVLATNLVNYQKLKIDIETTTAVYEEVLRQLEVAKITHLENIPLIQIVDYPILPLPDDKPSTLKMVVLAFFLGGFLVVAFLIGKRAYHLIMTGSGDES